MTSGGLGREGVRQAWRFFDRYFMGKHRHDPGGKPGIFGRHLWTVLCSFWFWPGIDSAFVEWSNREYRLFPFRFRTSNPYSFGKWALRTIAKQMDTICVFAAVFVPKAEFCGDWDGEDSGLDGRPNSQITRYRGHRIFCGTKLKSFWSVRSLRSNTCASFPSCIAEGSKWSRKDGPSRPVKIGITRRSIFQKMSLVCVYMLLSSLFIKFLESKCHWTRELMF